MLWCFYSELPKDAANLHIHMKTINVILFFCFHFLTFVLSVQVKWMMLLVLPRSSSYIYSASSINIIDITSSVPEKDRPSLVFGLIHYWILITVVHWKGTFWMTLSRLFGLPHKCWWLICWMSPWIELHVISQSTRLYHCTQNSTGWHHGGRHNFTNLLLPPSYIAVNLIRMEIEKRVTKLQL